jgi:transketolase
MTRRRLIDSTTGAPAEDVFREFGFTVENVVKKAKGII